MYSKGLGLSELESKVVFLAELGEKSGNPFFHHGVYRGEIEDDMLVFNSSIFLSVDQNKCKDIVRELRDSGVLLIRQGDERTTSYTNYYYYVASFTNKEKVFEEIGKRALEKAIKSIGEHPEFIKTLGYALISRYKSFKYVNKEKIELSPRLLDMLIKNCLLFKNRFVYTGGLSGINFFVPDAPFFRLLDHLNRKFLTFLLNEMATTELGVVDNYEEVRDRILSDSSFKRLGLSSYDTHVVDYIFDLAESLQIPYPVHYKQLYQRYKESIISMKSLERLSPLLRGAVETLDDSIQHFKRGTLPDFRLSLISIDNAIELMFRNHVLKKGVDIENMKKMKFEHLLNKCRDLEVLDDNIEKFKQIHEARNQLYHMPVLGVVEKLFIRGAINLAKRLFESETGEELKISLQRH